MGRSRERCLVGGGSCSGAMLDAGTVSASAWVAA